MDSKITYAIVWVHTRTRYTGKSLPSEDSDEWIKDETYDVSDIDAIQNKHAIVETCRNFANISALVVALEWTYESEGENYANQICDRKVLEFFDLKRVEPLMKK